MKKGFLFIVLHAHLPYVRHPEHEDFLEERWFFEAISETYIPLIDMFDRLLAEGVRYRMTMSLTPTLISMLTDPLLQERYVRHVNRLIELAEKEIVRTAHEPAFNRVAHMYRDRYGRAKEIFENRYGRNLVSAFRKFLDSGCLEIITCAATHGFLPLMIPVQSSVRAQIATACDHYEKNLGRRPQGIWLPECGYYPGYDQVLRENGLRYFLVENHGILHAEPRPRYGVYRPIMTPQGVYAFGRDTESSKQVWSAEEGYPGDYDYREYYRDIGFDLPEDYIRPYIHPDGIRINTGFKYYRITGTSDYKEAYDPDRAREKAASHAGNFMFNREKQVEYLYDQLGFQSVIVAPYDAELYGHWWFEGPQFLEFLIRKIVFDSPMLGLTNGPDYLDQFPRHQPSEPSFSSWGYKGFAEVWLEGSNDWIYHHLHAASRRMQELADRFKQPSDLERRALNQAARELMLAESSDWAFIMKTGTMVPYAIHRTREHMIRFLRIHHDLMNRQVDERWLSDIESKDNIFPDINYHLYDSASF